VHLILSVRLPWLVMGVYNMSNDDMYMQCGNCKDFPCDNSGAHLRWDSAENCTEFNPVTKDKMRRYSTPESKKDIAPDRRVNPFNETNKPKVIGIKDVIDTIGTIIKTPPLKGGDVGRFHIPIDYLNKKQTIVLSTFQLLKGPGLFTALFTDYYKVRLPISKKDMEWERFTDWVLEVSEEGEADETAAVMAGNILFEQITRTCNITKDRQPLTDGSNCKRLVEYYSEDTRWYVFPASAAVEYIGELTIKAPIDEIPQAMAACGYKRQGSITVRPPKKPGVKCWAFYADKVDEIKGVSGDEKYV